MLRLDIGGGPDPFGTSLPWGSQWSMASSNGMSTSRSAPIGPVTAARENGALRATRPGARANVGQAGARSVARRRRDS